MIAPTVPARRPSSGDSVVVLADRFGDRFQLLLQVLRSQVVAKAVVVVLQVLDEGLEVAYPGPQACRFEHETVVLECTLTQQGLCHTNSDRILRTREGRWMGGDRAAICAGPRRQECHRGRRRSTAVTPVNPVSRGTPHRSTKPRRSSRGIPCWTAHESTRPGRP